MYSYYSTGLPNSHSKKFVSLKICFCYSGYPFQEWLLKYNHFIFHRTLCPNLILNLNLRHYLLLTRCTKQTEKPCTGKNVRFWSVKSSEWSETEAVVSTTKIWEPPKSPTHVAVCPKFVWIKDNLHTVDDVL